MRTLPRSPHHRRPHRQQVLAVAASLWTVFLEFAKAIPQITLILTSALVLIIISVVLTKAFTERIITIEGILVPKLLSENGYTSDVASQRLRDAALKVAEKRNIPNLQMVLPNELPNIVVPAVGISINTLASFLQKLLFSDRRQGISGDLTVSNGQLWLHLRKDGQEFYVSEAGESIETPDKLLLTAASYVLKETNPYLFAKSQYTDDKDPEKALETAKRTIERFPNSETALWCYVLEGVIYHDRKEYQNAEQAFTRAAELNPRYAYTYLNWGFLLYDQGRPDEAIANFRRAIALDARVAEGYNNLGWALLERNQLDEAIINFIKAVELDPKLAMAYRNWGVALDHQGEYEQAITKYKKAIDTDSRLAVAFESWGNSLYSQRKFDEAIEKYNKAIEIDPESPISREYLEKSKSAAAKTKKSAPVDRE